MSRTFIKTYTFFALCILIGSLVFFAFQINSDMKTELMNAEKDFKYIANFIAQPPTNIKLGSEEHIKAIQELCDKAGNIENAMLSVSKNTILLSWARGNNKLYYNQNNELQMSGKSMTTKPYSTQIIVSNNPKYNNLTFAAGLNSISDYTIYRHARDMFFIFTGLLIITLIMIIINSLQKQETKIYANFTQPTKNNIKETAKSAPQKPQQTTPQSKYEPTEDLSNFVTSFSSQKTPSVSEPIPQQVETPEIATNKTEEEKPQTTQSTLFSENTGLCVETYLNEKLEAELGRSAASEQDLSLIIIKIKDMDHTDILAKKVANYLISEFNFKDILFEFSHDSFAVILHDADLMTSIKKAEAMYEKINELINLYAYSNKLAIGITTRTSRLIPATRMIEEALSAADKAMSNDTDPIVAFRADPQKYRQFISDYT